MIAFTDIKSE